jgi:hypothetical protein
VIGLAARGTAPAVLLLAVAAVPVRAQDVPYVVTLPASIRSVGLSGAGVALVGDAGGMFSNPAALATISHIALEGGYRAGPGSANLFSGALGWRLAQFDLGVGGRFFDFGPTPAQYIQGAPPGSKTREVLGTGSLVYRFGLIAMGVSGKYVRRSIDSTHVRGFSGDAGLAVAFFDIMALAFGVQNIGGNWRDGSPLVLPRLTRLGFTMNYVDPQESFRLLSTLEVQWPEGGGTRWVVGGEAGIVLEGVGIIARAGYGGDAAGLPNTNWSVGGSVALSAIKLDYAYRHRDLLDTRAHHLGFRMTL